ncbi:TPA: hypothetical protein DIV55_02345 [Patescibacteria group bacterium]|uniref:AB hydrolase-1 domain-containing protein n=1 Tax=Candidatus Gottesmanbacteria bacterium GW2011_GWA1_43_11 TaxID=1618436 RepID=A0A0G1EJX7_9BACT|nr:MAG: hypothetical protein UV59_C0042G0003 [Candidatus Gottesmanbacteria bacterium GW2011_GWA1_43_11]HCS78562.1 hypothetical protein [Patescibacteria group bacterium]
MIVNNNKLIPLSDGRKLAYAEHGDLKGKPLFFLHGWPGSRLRSAFYHTIAKKLHIRIISPDRPGFGRSDYQKNRTLLDYPDDVLELADTLHIKKFAVMGVSGGGSYAAACAYKIPNRITKVGIVVGVAPMYMPDLLSKMPWLYRMTWACYFKFPVSSYAGSLTQYIHSKLGNPFYYLSFLANSDQKLAKKYRREFTTITKEAFRQGIVGPARDLVLYTTDWEFDLKKIRAKVFLRYGAGDKNVPLVMGKYFEKQIPGSRLTVYPNEGHLISITHAEEIFKELVK